MTPSSGAERDENSYLIKQEAALRILKHQRRMALLTKWESMTAEERVIHLFSQQSDATMSKAAMEILASPNPTKSQKLRLHYGMQQTRPWKLWGFRRDYVSPVFLPVTGRISFAELQIVLVPGNLMPRRLRDYQ